MLKAIEIKTPGHELVDAIESLSPKVLKEMPEALRFLLENIKNAHDEFVNDTRPIQIIKNWVEQYEHDDQLDKLIAILVQEVIGRCGSAVQKAIKECDEGDGVTREEALSICIEQLEKMIYNVKQRKEKNPEYHH